MKDQTSPVTADVVIETQESEEIYEDAQSKSFSSLDITNNNDNDDIRNNDSDVDSGYINASTVSLEVEELPSWRIKIPEENQTELTEKEILKLTNTLYEQIDKISEEEKYDFIKDKLTRDYGKVLTKSLIDITISHHFDGDSGIPMDIRPEWLDIEKFKRGQKFAQEYIFGINYAELLSLFTVFSFEPGLKPLIVTDASSTPYTAFKRYLSTSIRVRNWYTSDPWTEGTAAYNDIRAVRRMHAMMRKKLGSMTIEDYENKTKIKNPWCPALSVTRRDFESSCPAAKPGQCYYTVLEKHPELKRKNLTQGDMCCSQFAFVGIAVLYPEFFGIHVSEEELESFCHLWRGIGYLLGIEDKHNFCRGTLEDVRERSRDFIEYWVKPNFRKVTPEWEHMMRCIIEGLQYYVPGVTYESCLYDLATILNIHMPRLYESFSYLRWIRRCAIRFYFDYASRLHSVRTVVNLHLNRSIERAIQYDEKKHNKLQEKSKKTLESYTTEVLKTKEIYKKYPEPDGNN